MSLLQLLLGAPNEQQRVAEELFKSGGYAKVSRLLDPLQETSMVVAKACTLLQSTSNLNSSSIRERLRDLGLLDTLIILARMNPRADQAYHSRISTLYNMSRSESLHTSFKETQFLQLVSELMPLPLLSKTHVICVITVAHVYGGDDVGGGAGGGMDPAAAAVLNGSDPSQQLRDMMEAVVHGTGSYMRSVWSLEEVLHGVQSLARSGKHAAALVQVGIPALLVEVLTAAGGEGDGRWVSDADVQVKACRTALNLAAHPPLVQPLLDAGLAAALLPYQRHADMRVVDAARGCLLSLGQLHDSKAVAAAEQNAAASALAGGGGGVADGAVAGGAAAAGGGHSFAGGEAAEPAVQFDVFLSHKRSDAKDFARALYNLLVLRGITTFLDFEFREELSDLDKIVARCRNLLFILTDNVFDSPWCMLELGTAVKKGINIVLVVKEGSRWRNTDGQKICEFPPYEMIHTLPEDIRHVFSRKAITHSDEYYQAFADLLLSKIKLPDGAGSAPPSRQRESHGGESHPPAHPHAYPHAAAPLPAPGVGPAAAAASAHPPAPPSPGPRESPCYQPALPAAPSPPPAPPPQPQPAAPRHHHHQQQQHQHQQQPQSNVQHFTSTALPYGPYEGHVEHLSPTPYGASAGPALAAADVSYGHHRTAALAAAATGAASGAASDGGAPEHLTTHINASGWPNSPPLHAGAGIGGGSTNAAPPAAPGDQPWPWPAPGSLPYAVSYPWGMPYPWHDTSASGGGAGPRAGPQYVLVPQHLFGPGAGLGPSSLGANALAALAAAQAPAAGPASSRTSVAGGIGIGSSGDGGVVVVEALQAEVHQLHRDLGGLQRDLSRTTQDLAAAAANSSRDVAELRRELAAHARDTSHALADLHAAVAAIGLQLQRATAAGWLRGGQGPGGMGGGLAGVAGASPEAMLLQGDGGRQQAAAPPAGSPGFAGAGAGGPGSGGGGSGHLVAYAWPTANGGVPYAPPLGAVRYPPTVFGYDGGGASAAAPQEPLAGAPGDLAEARSVSNSTSSTGFAVSAAAAVATARTAGRYSDGALAPPGNSVLVVGQAVVPATSGSRRSGLAASVGGGGMLYGGTLGGAASMMHGGSGGGGGGGTTATVFGTQLPRLVAGAGRRAPELQKNAGPGPAGRSRQEQSI